MDGTFSTPFGAMKKQTAMIAGGGIVLLSLMIYRSKKQKAAAAVAVSGANTGIDPTTGYTFGSPEDAAALANQSSYVNPSVPYAPGGSAGGSTTGSSPGSFVNNAQWAQYVEQTLVNDGSVTDATSLSAAVGKYLTGQPVDSIPNGRSLVEQAIAIGGSPPVQGPSGFPPSINTNPAGNSMPDATLANHPAQQYHPPAVQNGKYAAVAVGAEWWTETFSGIARAYGWPDANTIMADPNNATLKNQVHGDPNAKLPNGATVYAWFNPNHQESSSIWASIPAPNPNWPASVSA